VITGAEGLFKAGSRVASNREEALDASWAALCLQSGQALANGNGYGLGQTLAGQRSQSLNQFVGLGVLD
jgi:hypothetical protein